MIHVYIRGRLGNQLFQYAFVRMLQHHNPEQQAVYHFDEVYSAGTPEQDFINALKDFNTVGVNEVCEHPKLTIVQRALLKLYWYKYPHTAPIDLRTKYQKRWLRWMNNCGLYYLDIGYYPFNKKLKGDIIVSGNFECEQYFEEIKEQIIKELTPKQSVSKRNQKFLDKIQTTNSVSISIRRGDFVEDSGVAKLHNVCTKTYYWRAVEYIKKHVENPVLFVFSNDIEWVKQNMSFDIDTYYENGDTPSWEVLELMSNCKHFIISNSSFNWWAQYRGTFKDKIVIAPERWFNSPLIPDVFLDTWVKLPVS